MVKVLTIIAILTSSLIALGYRSIGMGYAQHFIDLHRNVSSPISARQGFLFEGVLGDLLAYIFTYFTSDSLFTVVIWSVAGAASVAAALYIGVRNKSFTWDSIIVLCAFTRLLDGIVWVGKMDFFLEGALALSANRRNWISHIGIATACFLHPLLSLVSTIGLFSLDWLLDGRLRWRLVAISLFFSTLDLIIFRTYFPQLNGRINYLSSDLVRILVNGLVWGVPSLLVSVAYPVLSILCIIETPFDLPARRFVPPVVWVLSLGLLTSFFVLDHTRDAAIALLAPCLRYTRNLDFSQLRGSYKFNTNLLLVTLFVARLAMPHYDESGPDTFHWMHMREKGCRILSLYAPADGSWTKPGWC